MSDDGATVQNPPPNHQKVPGLIRNFVSLIGGTIAVIGAANIAFLVVIEMMSSHASPYIGIFAYMVMPGVLVFGLILIPIGMLLERKRRSNQEHTEYLKYPRIDLNDPGQRAKAGFLISFIVVFIAISAAGSYRAYEFTESVQFCGQLCHTVMNPEYVAYQQSPHARVACVDCHVGAGAGWYVKSKLSGAYQVYSVTFHKYPKPIATPVQNLRPAPETCEQCHWPKKFYGAQLKVFSHFATDEKNTPRQIRMLLKTGGGDPKTGAPAGIHWHMNIANEITYFATDRQRQVIPWVQAKNLDGKVTVYTARDAKLTPGLIQNTAKRRMDCVDCHNRPTHIYVPPDRSVDESLYAKRIDGSLPWVKQQAVALLTANYKTPAEAESAISKGLNSYYQAKYPDLSASHKLEIQAAGEEIKRIYNTTIFPEMKVDWRVHPNNIGHLYSAGCFRCHDGNHVSSDGKVISKDCTVCHTVLGQTEAGQAVAGVTEGAPFVHPVDLGDLTAVSCADCHTGGVSP